MNSLMKLVKNITEYITSAATRIFSPSDDEYPEIGMQSFEGEPYAGGSEID